jgi:ClpX C4-type zinc finger
MSGAGADPPQVSPGPRLSLESIRCSFCGKRGDEVDAIVAGSTPSLAICNECVDLCSEIIAEQQGPPTGPAGPAPAA